MARSNTTEQVERGLLSPNTAATLMGYSSNTVRGWIRKGYLRKIRIPFTNDIQVSALELLIMALKWKHPFNPQLFQAAKNYVYNFQPDNIEQIDILEVAYKNRELNTNPNLHKESVSIDDLIQIASRPLPTISSKEEHH